jgi:ABC-2 type transport system permease protein
MVKSPKQMIRSSSRQQLLLTALLVVLINIASTFFFTRVDLTADKRFTLNKTTIELIKNMDDIVFFKVYLDGDLPANYKKLRDEFKQMLDEFRSYNTNIQYEFIDPSASSDEKERNRIYAELYKDGLNYATPTEKKKGEISKQIVWPGAIVSYRSKRLPLQLITNQTYANEEEVIIRAINDLEYQLSNAIRKLTVKYSPTVAFIEGHGELDTLQTKDAMVALSEYYQVQRIRIDSNINSLVFRNQKGDSVSIKPRYKAIIIAKPTEPFSERDQFIIDQYVMYGGRVFFLIDPLVADLDSIAYQPAAMAYPYDLKLDELLFKYGVRINQHLVTDLRCASIPVVTGQVGNQPTTKFFKWFYSPLAFPESNHPIVNNLNAIRFDFASTIDFVGNADLKKTVLLQTSENSNVTGNLPRYTLNLLKQKPQKSDFTKSGLPLVVLLEGSFESFYKRRVTPQIAESKLINFREKSLPTAIIVAADGDIIRNKIAPNGSIFPLGYDRYTREMFGNRDFIVNCVNYLCDDQGLIALRGRTIKLRLLDEQKIAQTENWQKIKNVALPIFTIWLLGVIIFTWRKRAYGKL